jgi:NAD(P)-dependent dehydrogenase (short-subunit alcohol dehydrogenase family)
MSTKVVLVIGASRGIGLEFVRQYRADGWRVLASARSAEGLARLKGLGAEPIDVDVMDLKQIDKLKSTLAHIALDVAIINAGVLTVRGNDFTPGEEDFDVAMHTNVLAAMRLVPVLEVGLKQAKGVLAMMSSRMGSIDSMSSPSELLYRVSKAALNAVMKGAALRLGPKDVRVLALHPGWVRTDMGGSGASLDVGESVHGLRRVIQNASVAQNGLLFDYQGSPIPF